MGALLEPRSSIVMSIAKVLFVAAIVGLAAAAPTPDDLVPEADFIQTTKTTPACAKKLSLFTDYYNECEHHTKKCMSPSSMEEEVSAHDGCEENKFQGGRNIAQGCAPGVCCNRRNKKCAGPAMETRAKGRQAVIDQMLTIYTNCAEGKGCPAGKMDKWHGFAEENCY